MEKTRTDKFLMFVSGIFPNMTLNKKMIWVIELTNMIDRLQRETREALYKMKNEVRAI